MSACLITLLGTGFLTHIRLRHTHHVMHAAKQQNFICVNKCEQKGKTKSIKIMCNDTKHPRNCADHHHPNYV